MHPNQLHIDTNLASEIIAEQFPDYRDEPVVQAGMGTVNVIFRIGNNFAARFPLQLREPLEAYETLQREAKAIGEFATYSTVAAPRPLAIGRPARGYPMPWSVQSWIDGDVATPDQMSQSNRFASDIAKLIVALRRTEVGGRSFDDVGRGGDIRKHDDWMATCFERSSGLLDVPRLMALWSQFRELPNPSTKVMSHKDLIPANLLVRDGQLIGVLDTGSFGPADPSLDLVAAWHLFDVDRRWLMRERLGSDDVEWRRGAAWAFEQAMGLVWYYETSNPMMAALGRSTLDRVLNDPELNSRL